MIIGKYLKKGDILVFFSIILIGILPFLLTKPIKSEGQPYIAVYQYNELIKKYQLNQGEDSEFINFEFKVDGKEYYGILETKKSKVRLLRLPEELVPKSIHSDINWIEDSNKIIVALPVSLVISIENSPNKVEHDVDVISY